MLRFFANSALALLSTTKFVWGYTATTVHLCWNWCRYTLPLWFSLLAACLLLSFLSFFAFDLDLLIAPVIKLISFLKVAVLALTSAGIHYAKMLLKMVGALALAIFGSWEAWSAKKMLRHGLRASASIATRFFALNLLINLFFGKERKGLRNLPRWTLFKLSSTWFGRVLSWWSRASDRVKRITTGAVLCVILVLAGQAFIGMSILIFDLVWELLIILFRQLINFWRFIAPILLKLIPNAISTFVTQRLLPLFSEAVPLVRDDHRIIYARFDLRERYRRLKKRLLIYSRAKRSPLRLRLRGLLPDNLRQLKNRLLDSAAGFTASAEKNERVDDNTNTSDNR